MWLFDNNCKYYKLIANEMIAKKYSLIFRFFYLIKCQKVLFQIYNAFIKSIEALILDINFINSHKYKHILP
jgi:hypothetical protein